MEKEKVLVGSAVVLSLSLFILGALSGDLMLTFLGVFLSIVFLEMLYLFGDWA